MRVKVLRPLWYAGEMRKIGVVVDLPDQMAREAIYIGKAERVVEDAKPLLAGAMTTASAGELVSGKKHKGGD